MNGNTDVAPLVFGVYPGGQAGSDEGLAVGPPDSEGQITEALARLQAGRIPFVVRAYEKYCDAGTPRRYPERTPERYEAFATDGRRLDLVAQFNSAKGDVAGYLQFVRGLVRRHASRLYSLQVTEEANFSTGPDAIDGAYPRVREALVAGVQAARDELDRVGLGRSVLVGFSTTPTFGPGAEFWDGIGRLGGRAFVSALDYVALDFFPDVFRPAAPDGEPGDVRESALLVLRALRDEWLPAAGIGRDVAIHIGEHGWPTTSTRPYDRQARVLETVIRTVSEHRAALGVTRYTLFGLRDAASDRDEIWFQFGVMRHDYTPKPAFEAYERLVKELG